jgi:hypothetical protein
MHTLEALPAGTTTSYGSELPQGSALTAITGTDAGSRMEWWTCNGRRFMLCSDAAGHVEVWHAIEPFPNPELRKALLEVLCYPIQDSQMDPLPEE